MISDYCKQSALWKHITGHDKYTQPVYAAQISIKVRKEEKIRLVRDKKGVQVMSNTTYFTSSAIIVDDLLDGYTVIAVNPMTGLDGQIEGYEVMT